MKNTTTSPLRKRLLECENAEPGNVLPIVHKLIIRSIGCPRETFGSEARVAVTPETAALYQKMGNTVKVEEGAGLAANFPDSLYSAAGAIIVSADEALQCDLILKVRAPCEDEVSKMKEGSTLFCLLWPAQNANLVAMLTAKKINCFAMDQIPRISRAQVYDALSSMANIAGYKAVVEASHHFGRFLGGQITAAGRIPPAKVLIIGAGVAGLSAIATAKKMGAIVRCFDTRPVCREQVASLGGEFLELEGFELAEGTGGYAKAMSEDFLTAEMDLFRKQAADVDIIITTALIPGKPAPRLILKDMIEAMKPGSVTVDLAAEQGGNIETTIKDTVYITENGVTCIGYTDLPSRLPAQSSKLYSQNVLKLIGSMYDKTSRALTIDFSDLVTRASLVTYQGEDIWPAPAHLFPKPPPPPKAPAPPATLAQLSEENRKRTLASAIAVAVGFCAMISMNMISHDPNLLTMIVVFTLAGTAGYQAVWGVTPALHTPLMSVTNAISGVTALGGLVLLAAADNNTSLAIGGLATGASFINIVGGFTVTARMLDMFRRPGDPEEHNYLYWIPAFCTASLFLIGRIIFGLDLSELTYLAASMCCIVAIGGLSQQSTARFGNSMGIVGVTIGVICTLGTVTMTFKSGSIAFSLVCAGAICGHLLGHSVQVTELPQTVAAFHSLVGLAAMVTAVGHFIVHPYDDPEYNMTTGLSAIIGTFIGGITLTGSLVAFAKLHGLASSKPVHLWGKNFINGSILLIQIFCVGAFLWPGNSNKNGLHLIYATAFIALFLGWHTVASIGGGDMPVCITVLNSYSGWALVAEGFMLDNLMLTIVGSLIGFSGGILSYIMCKAMNRSLANVLFGGYATLAPSSKKNHEQREHKETSVEEVVDLLVHAKKVMIVPGYGMAVARAQYAVADLARTLRAKEVETKFGIHPVAGRMPGQMNVLLAEAGVPYDWVFEMEEINDEFAECDVALVVGANDITNSAAEEDPTCAIAGMPVLKVWNAKTCIYMKRTMGSGYADLENPVFYKDNTLMMLGDAKKTTEAFAARLKDYYQV